MIETCGTAGLVVLIGSHAFLVSLRLRLLVLSHALVVLVPGSLLIAGLQVAGVELIASCTLIRERQSR